MKQIISVRSNTFYEEKQGEDKLQINPLLELIIIYIDGKEYTVTKDNLKPKPKVSETRLLVSPEMLRSLIGQLETHRVKLDNAGQSAEVINEMIKVVTK